MDLSTYPSISIDPSAVMSMDSSVYGVTESIDRCISRWRDLSIDPLVELSNPSTGQCLELAGGAPMYPFALEAIGTMSLEAISL